MSEEREPAVEASAAAEVYDAFLVDPARRPSDREKPDRLAPIEMREVIRANTRNWPTRYCIRNHAHEGRAMILVTPVPESTMLHAKSDPRHPGPRYTWTELRPGVLAGRLIDEDQRQIEADILVDRKALGLTD